MEQTEPKQLTRAKKQSKKNKTSTKLAQQLKTKYGNTFPDQNAVVKFYQDGEANSQKFQRQIAMLQSDPQVTRTNLGQLETMLGKKIVEALTTKVWAVHSKDLLSIGVSRKQLVQLIAASYVADDWKEYLWNAAAKYGPTILSALPRIIDTIKGYFKIGESQEPSLGGQIQESMLNYAQRPDQFRLSDTPSLESSLKTALCTVINPSKYAAQVPRPSGEINYSVPNNFRIRIPVTTNASGNGAVTVAPWALNDGACVRTFSAAALDLFAGTNGGASTNAYAAPLTSLSYAKSWVCNSVSCHWEPTSSALNQQGTTYMAYIPDFTVAAWPISFPTLTTLQNILPDVSGPAISSRDILFIGDVTDQFTNNPVYGGNLVEVVTFIINGGPASATCGNVIVDFAYETRTDNTVYPLVRPSAMPSSNKFCDLLSALEWSGSVDKQSLSERTQQQADEWCTIIQSPHFDVFNPRLYLNKMLLANYKPESYAQGA